MKFKITKSNNNLKKKVCIKVRSKDIGEITCQRK